MMSFNEYWKEKAAKRRKSCAKSYYIDGPRGEAKKMSASSPVYLKAPIGYMTTATFKVGDEEMVIEERVFPKAPIKDTIAIFPYAKDRSFRKERLSSTL